MSTKQGTRPTTHCEQVGRGIFVSVKKRWTGTVIIAIMTTPLSCLISALHLTSTVLLILVILNVFFRARASKKEFDRKNKIRAELKEKHAAQRAEIADKPELAVKLHEQQEQELRDAGVANLSLQEHDDHLFERTHGYPTRNYSLAKADLSYAGIALLFQFAANVLSFFA